LGSFRVLLDEITLNKTLASSVKLDLPDSLTPGSSYGDAQNIKILVDQESFTFTKSVSGRQDDQLVKGNYFEVSPGNVCAIESTTEIQKILGIGTLKTFSAGMCNFKITFGGSEKYEQSSYNISLPVLNPIQQNSSIKIRCKKGNSYKYVVGIKPKCPSGFKKQP
jgi:hypothetical protein